MSQSNNPVGPRALKQIQFGVERIAEAAKIWSNLPTCNAPDGLMTKCKGRVVLLQELFPTKEKIRKIKFLKRYNHLLQAGEKPNYTEYNIDDEVEISQGHPLFPLTLFLATDEVKFIEEI